jgi:hypothetical protein
MFQHITRRLLPRGRPCRTASLLVIVAIACVAAPVSAAEAPSLDVQTWRPAPGLHDGLMLRGASVQGHGAWSAFTDLSYTRAPLRFSSKATGFRLEQAVIGDLAMLQLGAAAGWRDRWAFGAVLPIAGVMRGGGPNLTQVEPPDAPAFGDIRLDARYLLFHQARNGVTSDLAAAVVVGLPTAAQGSWLGGTASGGVEVLATLQAGPWRGDLNAGVRLQQTEALTVQRVDAQGQVQTDAAGKPIIDTALRAGSVAIVRAGVLRTLWLPQARVRAELQVLAPLVSTMPSGQTVLDLALGGDWALTDAWRLYLALGGAPTSGPGSTGFRAAFGVRFDPQQLPHDTDGDGIDDRLDRCPIQAEDKDAFEDDDGCPDPDNDDDGILDAADTCANAAEDKDGFQDDDGCADRDNDGDGILDDPDKCPNQAEDRDGFDDDDGCPDSDNDQDGIPDVHDLCPLTPEKRNTFEDEDGCPDVAPGQPAVVAPPPPPPAVPAPATPEKAAPAPAIPPEADKKSPGGKAVPATPAPEGKPRVKVKPI